jgi:collagen beta-1,O-galactosyltransferase
MKCHIIIIYYLVSLFNITYIHCDSIFKKPNILIGILARNKAHTLPYTLSYLEKLNYPTNRIALW